jgi:hypothetical protein
MAKWIRPAPAPTGTKLEVVNEIKGEVHQHGIVYVVAHARVPTMDYNPAIEVEYEKLLPTPRKGPFLIGPMCIGKVFSEEGGYIDADWFFEIYDECPDCGSPSS